MTHAKNVNESFCQMCILLLEHTFCCRCTPPAGQNSGSSWPVQTGRRWGLLFVMLGSSGTTSSSSSLWIHLSRHEMRMITCWFISKQDGFPGLLLLLHRRCGVPPGAEDSAVAELALERDAELWGVVSSSSWPHHSPSFCGELQQHCADPESEQHPAWRDQTERERGQGEQSGRNEKGRGCWGGGQEGSMWGMPQSQGYLSTQPTGTPDEKSRLNKLLQLLQFPVTFWFSSCLRFKERRRRCWFVFSRRIGGS